MGCGGHQASGEGATALRRIVRTPESRRDLDDIWDYIAHDNVVAADALIDRVDAKLIALSEYPRLGTDRSRLSDGLRSFTVMNYLLFYQPLSDGIELIRVLHASRDLSKVFPDR